MNKSAIAIIDDHKDTRAMLQTFLEQWYDVRSYRDAGEAFDQMKKTPPQAVLTDILLADVDGMELLRWMRADPLLRNVPLVAMSGLPYTESLKHVGFDQYLVKPVDFDQLLAAIRTCLAERPAPRALKVA